MFIDIPQFIRLISHGLDGCGILSYTEKYIFLTFGVVPSTSFALSRALNL